MFSHGVFHGKASTQIMIYNIYVDSSFQRWRKTFNTLRVFCWCLGTCATITLKKTFWGDVLRTTIELCLQYNVSVFGSIILVTIDLLPEPEISSSPKRPRGHCWMVNMAALQNSPLLHNVCVATADRVNMAERHFCRNQKTPLSTRTFCLETLWTRGSLISPMPNPENQQKQGTHFLVPAISVQRSIRAFWTSSTTS